MAFDTHNPIYKCFNYEIYLNLNFEIYKYTQLQIGKKKLMIISRTVKWRTDIKALFLDFFIFTGILEIHWPKIHFDIFVSC